MLQKFSFKVLGLAGILSASSLLAQPVSTPTTNKPKSKAPYETVANDPLKTRIYTLSNGMKVYMSVYKDAPRIQTYIAVKAGSKNDPKDATGLAHYLEHMVFKGTDKYGTKDFAKEEPLIKKIEELYEVYRKTKDEAERKKIYHQIDSVSGEAAKYAIANEYDKMTSALGCSGTNAFTSFEQTVYVNEIPSNQLDNWLTLEAERYRKPVLRLFHTELEAVYEEKNRGLDNDGTKVFEALLSGLFKNHNYGLQTTIGTIDHLKNPSLKEINKYYNTYYVPNNMAICISGDFNPDEAIKTIEAKFGSMKPKPVPPYKFLPEKPILSPIVKEVLGPSEENVMFAFRHGGVGTKDADLAKMLSLVLTNGKAGLIDLNLNQSQKVIGGECFSYVLKDYGILGFYGQSKEGQKLEEVKDLMLAELEKVKKGEFPDYLMGAIISDLKLQQTKSFEQNNSRAMEMVGAFVTNQSWQAKVDEIARLSKITKQQLMAFAKKSFNNNYCVVYKRIGEDKNVQKVEKPQITPVSVNREDQSPFLKSIVEANYKPIEPAFIDYEKDIAKFTIKSNIPVLYYKNSENSTFDMYYVFDMGSNNDKVLPIAIEYLPFLGTAELSSKQVQEEFYKLGCSFNVFNSADQVYVSLSGLSENADKAIDLFENLLNNPKADDEALENLIADKLKEREDAKLNKGVILRQGLVSYAKFGPKNSFTNILSETELKSLKPEELIAKIKGLESYEHRVLYYGTKSEEELKTSLNKSHIVPATLKPVPAVTEFPELETGNNVYVIDYDMKQVEIVMMAKGKAFDPKEASTIGLYNEYFGGSMSSVVFQELRESRALAYSVSSMYRQPAKQGKSYYLNSYIGSQADKLPEAMKGMNELLNDMPKSDVMFNAAKDAMISSLRTERVTKADILFNYENAKKLGLSQDLRRDLFANVPALSFDDIKKFQEQNIKGKSFTVCVLGKKENLDVKTLEKYGKVTYLTLKDVFGY